MATKEIMGGVVHKLPRDLRKILISTPKLLPVWERITPLARNEWICWIESAKKTRNKKSQDANTIRKAYSRET